MLVYTISIYICFFLKILNKKKLKNITLVFLTLLAGLRYNVGADYLSYRLIFNRIKLGEKIRTEPLYWLLNKISFNYTFLLTLVAFLSLYLVFKFINYLDKQNFYFILFGYFSIYYLQWNLSTIRQGIAISFFLYSSIFLFEKKYKKYLFIILIGCFFHKSLVLAFLLYPILKWDIKEKYLLFMFIFFKLFENEIFMLLENFILYYKISYSSYFLGYVKNQLVGLGITKTYLTRIFIYIFIVVLDRKKNIKDYKIHVIRKIVCFLVGLNLIFQNFSIAIRALKFYEIFVILSCFYLVKYCFKNLLFLKCAQVLIMLITTIYYFYYINAGPMYYPYESILSIKEYENKSIRLHLLKYEKTKAIFEKEGYTKKTIEEFYRMREVID
ncbi:EpsG family protein [Fusobacterium canifelinum]|uniref:EpsG family protein n=1 Tax=Fusobacterium canifelinum TaxID=285729 RepID=A0A3P1UZ57_9FUSO|nr:EpsG family protein [Fusobacterium canifelinum]RRD27112.1 EpsG family protein [Fusobacterium canifelinum]